MEKNANGLTIGSSNEAVFNCIAKSKAAKGLAKEKIFEAVDLGDGQIRNALYKLEKLNLITKSEGFFKAAVSLKPAPKKASTKKKAVKGKVKAKAKGKK